MNHIANRNNGTSYVYTTDSNGKWSQMQKLQCSDYRSPTSAPTLASAPCRSSSRSQFGYKTSLYVNNSANSNNFLIVGAPSYGMLFLFGATQICFYSLFREVWYWRCLYFCTEYSYLDLVGINTISVLLSFKFFGIVK